MLSHRPADGAKAFEPDPARAAGLRTRPDHQFPMVVLDLGPSSIRGDRWPARYVPPALGGVPGGGDGIAFLHGRRAPGGGGERLVIARFETARVRGSRFSFALGARAFVPAGWRPGSRRAAAGPGTELVLPFDPTESEHLTLGVGVPDEGDASRFTIGYAFRGRAGTIDGHLRSSGGPGSAEMAILSVRDGPPAGAGPSASAGAPPVRPP